LNAGEFQEHVLRHLAAERDYPHLNHRGHADGLIEKRLYDHVRHSIGAAQPVSKVASEKLSNEVARIIIDFERRS
jgi:hypothetical protein